MAVKLERELSSTVTSELDKTNHPDYSNIVYRCVECLLSISFGADQCDKWITCILPNSEQKPNMNS